MALKWIINDKEIRMGNVVLHMELQSKGCKVPGGGFFHLMSTQDFLFYGESVDFGQVSSDEFLEAELSPSIERRGVKIYFTRANSLENALRDYNDGKIVCHSK